MARGDDAADAGRDSSVQATQRAIRLLRLGLTTNDDMRLLSTYFERLENMVASSSHKRIVVSCPEMTTLDPEGAPPYDQHAMDYVLGLQQQGYMRLGFDRAGSSTARSEDAPLFASGDPEKIKETMWFYGYATATKRCISLESQNFDGLLELVCIDGGPVTSIEAREMPRILAESVHDAELLEVEIQCEFKISQMAYCDFVREYPGKRASVDREAADEGGFASSPRGSSPSLLGRLSARLSSRPSADDGGGMLEVSFGEADAATATGGGTGL